MGKKRNCNPFYIDIMSMSPEVTGSCLYVTEHFSDYSFKHFIVDCGLFQEPEYRYLNSELLFNTDNVDFVAVTHNHIDHTAKLPFLVKHGLNVPIYCTSDTESLMPLALKDTVSIMQNRIKRDKNSAIYTESHVKKTIKLLNGCEYNKPLKVTDGTTITFFKNGHLIGAALILVQINCYGENPINILFMGDYNDKNMFFEVPELPKWVLDLPLTIICESTYGYMDSSEIENTFIDNIVQFFKNTNNSTIITPVFSLGRSQEVLKILKQMQENGEISNIPIYLDGKLTHKYTDLFINGNLTSIDSDKSDFLPDNSVYVGRNLRAKLLKSPIRKIIVSSSGMGSYGPAQSYIQKYIQQNDSLIHFTGYAAEGTISRELFDTPKEDIVNWGGLILNKKADVLFTNEFSAHAKADEIITFLRKFHNLQTILVTHGTTESKYKMAKRIVKEGIEVRDIGILSRDYFFRIAPTGLIKTCSSKFL